MVDGSGKRGGNALQTLDRGLRTLEIVAARDDGVSIAELAGQLGVHRAIAYRLASTLEAHGMVTREPGGRLLLGPALLVLAERYAPHLRTAARPLLDALARETGAVAFLSLAQGADCVAVLVAEPERGTLRLAYRVGSRHPLTRGAAGLAILAGREARATDAEPVRDARRLGYALTRGELQPGAVGVAVPIAGLDASAGVVALGELDVDAAASAVTGCATALAQALRTSGAARRAL